MKTLALILVAVATTSSARAASCPDFSGTYVLKRLEDCSKKAREDRVAFPQYLDTAAMVNLGIHAGDRVEIAQKGCEELRFTAIRPDGKRSEAFPMPLHTSAGYRDDSGTKWNVRLSDRAYFVTGSYAANDDGDGNVLGIPSASRLVQRWSIAIDPKTRAFRLKSTIGAAGVFAIIPYAFVTGGHCTFERVAE